MDIAKYKELFYPLFARILSSNLVKPFLVSYYTILLYFCLKFFGDERHNQDRSLNHYRYRQINYKYNNHNQFLININSSSIALKILVSNLHLRPPLSRFFGSLPTRIKTCKKKCWVSKYLQQPCLSSMTFLDNKAFLNLVIITNQPTWQIMYTIVLKIVWLRFLFVFCILGNMRISFVTPLYRYRITRIQLSCNLFDKYITQQNSLGSILYIN